MFFIGIVVGFVLGILLAMLLVVVDKNVKIIKEDEIVVSRQEIIDLKKAYTLAMRRIDPDFDND